MLIDIAYDTRPSGTGKLHDLSVDIEEMTPSEYRNGGINLSINYSFYRSYLGDLIIASTSKGICHIGFSDSECESIADLRRRFPNVEIRQKSDAIQKVVIPIFNYDWRDLLQVKLHLKGTEFQLKVWRALLTIPMGHLSTYGAIADQIGKPKASRAVGTAIGNNPVAYLIPCHRVIQSSGAFGKYYWGDIRKKAIIDLDAVKAEEL